MPTFSVSETVAAPPEAVWPILVDVLRWPEWTPSVSRVEALDGPQFEIGARYKIFQPKLRPAVWTVTEIKAAESFSWETQSLGMRIVAEHNLIRVKTPEDGSQTTWVELRLTFTGCLGRFVGLLASSMSIKYMTTEATMLKARFEPTACQTM